MDVRHKQVVVAGQVIGATGKSGNAKGPQTWEDHLHFGISTSSSARAGMATWLNPVGYRFIVGVTVPPPKPDDVFIDEAEKKRWGK